MLVNDRLGLLGSVKLTAVSLLSLASAARPAQILAELSLTENDATCALLCSPEAAETSAPETTRVAPVPTMVKPITSS